MLGYYYYSYYNRELVNYYGMENPGDFITEIDEGSLFGKAGIQVGDVVVSADGKSIEDDYYYIEKAKAKMADGESVAFRIERPGVGIMDYQFTKTGGTLISSTELSDNTVSSSASAVSDSGSSSARAPSASGSSVSSGSLSLSDATMYTPTITNALKISNWLNSGINRALMAFSLGANAADDAVLSRADILYAIMQNNPTFVGKDTNNKNLIVATVCDADMVFLYYSPTVKKAYVLLIPNNNGTGTNAAAVLEMLIANTSSIYYRVTEEDMKLAIAYLQSVL